MKKYLILLLFFTTSVLADGIPTKHNTDDVTIGYPTSTASPAGLFFNVGDGASNPKISVDKVLKTFDLDKDTRVQGDLSLGTGVSSDRSIIVDEGSGANNPELKWDTAANKWKQFDGTTERDIGAGGGGGSDAINILSASNPDAEDGVINWTFAGTGAFSVTSTASAIYDGEKSFNTDFDVQAETLKSSEITLKEGLLGQACQARFFYIGGDDSVDITATIRNGNDAIVSGSDSVVLKNKTIWTPADLFFLCPNATDVAGDAQLGNLYLQFEQTGAGNSTAFRHDKVHLGGLIGLVEALTPDMLSARVLDGSPATVFSENADFINGDCSRTGTGDYNCPFNSGLFTVPPSCSANIANGSRTRISQISSVSTASVDIITSDQTDAAVNADFNLYCQKQGVDAKQSVTVYKNVPKISENINEYSVETTTISTVIGSQNTNWTSGVTNPSLGLTSIAVNAGVFSLAPICTCSIQDGGVNRCSYSILESSASTLSFRTSTPAGAGTNADIVAICQKQSTDFNLPTVQPILVNQVETSNEKGITEEKCRIDNSGTPTVNSGSGLCESWIDSLGDTGVGHVTVNFKAGIFASPPVCNCTPNVDSFDRDCTAFSETTSLVIVKTADNAAAAADINFNLSCGGKRQ